MNGMAVHGGARSGRKPGRELLVPIVAAVAGFGLGAGLALTFNLLHSNWDQIPGVTSEATSTVPYWVVQFLGPIFVSVCWTALALHARSVPRWKLLAALTLLVQVALLAVSVVPIAIAGNGGVWIGNFAQPLLVLVAVLSPVLGAVWPPGQRATGVGWHLLAAAVFAVALWLGQSLWARQTLLI